MPNNAKTVCKKGEWVYDGNVLGQIQIVSQAVDPPEFDDDPPRGDDGRTYHIEYVLPVDGTRPAGGGYFATLGEAMECASKTLNRPITWSEEENSN